VFNKAINEFLCCNDRFAYEWPTVIKNSYPNIEVICDNNEVNKISKRYPVVKIISGDVFLLVIGFPPQPYNARFNGRNALLLQYARKYKNRVEIELLLNTVRNLLMQNGAESV
jgi:hypothetical protein